MDVPVDEEVALAVLLVRVRSSHRLANGSTPTASGSSRRRVLLRAAAVGTATVAGVRVGFFPDLYAAVAGDPPNHVITL